MSSDPYRLEAPPILKCPRCREPIAGDASVCPRCRSSALVDVVVLEHPSDGRLRYQAARALTAVQPGLKLVAIQQALGQEGGKVLSGVTPGVGAAGVAALERLGIRSGITAAEVATPWLTTTRAVLLAAGFVAVVGAIVCVRLLDTVGRVRVASVEAGAKAPSGGPQASAPVLSTTQIAQRALPSIVSLRCATTLGTGFFVGDDLVMTNAHVLCDNDSSIRVVFEDRREFVGQVVQADANRDLALVRVSNTGAHPLPMGDVGTLSVGQKLVMIGSPVGLDFTVHEAAVSNLSHSLLGVAYIQIEAKVNPGNSGGPLLDEQGRVVGVVTLKKRDAEGIGFALPINYAYTATSPGASPLIAEAPAVSTNGFTEMQAKADAETDEAARRVSTTPLLSIPAGAYVDEYKRLVLRIIRPARSMPRSQDVTVNVRRGGATVLCTMKSTVTEWKFIERSANRYDPRVQTWLDKVGVGDIYTYLGEAPLHPEQCPREAIGRGMELELEEGDPRASKLLLQ